MNYRDGQPVMIGDAVTLGEGITGTVVCTIDDRRGTPAFPIAEWEYLRRGIILDSPAHGIIHLEAPDVDLVLVARGNI
jgi:hypothetical protein